MAILDEAFEEVFARVLSKTHRRLQTTMMKFSRKTAFNEKQNLKVSSILKRTRKLKHVHKRSSGKGEE